jgi:hypothetical protein
MSRTLLLTRGRRCGLKRQDPVRASLGQWSYLDDATVSETGAFLGDSNGFCFVRHLKVEISTDRFLRLRERAVDHDVATLAGNKLAHVAQWMTALALALLNESLEPSHPFGRDFLKLCVGELFEPGIPSEEQQVIVLMLRVHGLTLVASLSRVHRQNDPTIFRNEEGKASIFRVHGFDCLIAELNKLPKSRKERRKKRVPI